MDLTTTYCGLDLAHPLMPGASPLVDDLDSVRRLEDAGASAIVMRSLFEEQIAREYGRTAADVAVHDAFAEASSFLPRPSEFRLGPEAYLTQVRRIKESVGIPVIGSLNGVTEGGWIEYARLIEQAGADALELNVYQVATDPRVDGAAVEERVVAVTRAVRRAVKIPFAVKLSPFFSSLPHLAARLDEAGADGLVLFNRFHEPHIDIDELEARPELRLSDRHELPLRLRWLAILSGQRDLDFAVSGGVHGALDVVAAVMAGASAVQMVSSLLRNGVDHLIEVREDLVHWLEERDYSSLRQMTGSMNLARCPDPAAFERGNYMRMLQSWRG